MFRLRRYRVFLVFAVITIGALYHFTTLSDIENAGVASVEGLRNLGHKESGAESLPPVPPPIEIEKISNDDDDTESSPTPSPTSSTRAPSLPVDEPVEEESITSTPKSSYNTPRPLAAEPVEEESIASTPKFSLNTPSPTVIEPDEEESTASTPTPTSAVDEETVQKPLVDKDGSLRNTKLRKPFLDDTEDEFGQGRLDGVSDVRDTPIHWSQLPEHFPVPPQSIIPLPSGKPKAIPKIQHLFSDESANDKIDRLQKLDAIKGAFATSWDGYKKNAWMHDELSPDSGLYRDPFCGWAATLVDTLDTLWIMGLKDEFEEATNAVKNIDFTTSNRQDIPLFETVIRYLGGLIAAYDLSSGTYRILLDKAVELAEILMGAFDTPNRMPMTFYPWKPTFASNPHRASPRVVLAELGSLSVEFTRLAQITKKSKYYDAIARITNELETWQNNTKMPGLWPKRVDASGCKKATMTKTTQLEHSLLNGPGNGISQIHTGLSLNDNGTARTGNPNSPDGDALEDESKEKTNAGRRESSDSRTFQETDAPPGIDTLSNSKVGTIKRQLSDEATEVSTESTGPTSNEMPDCEAQGLASPPSSDSEDFTLGGEADSTYEYLPKEYMLLGGLEDVYRSMYENAIETTKKYLLFRPMLPDERDILLSGMVKTTGDLEDPDDIALKPEGTHLTCFVGGMFAIGAKIFDRKDDLVLAQKLTDGCVWAYESTTTGIMPEHYLVAPCEGLEKCSWNETKYHELLDPHREWRLSQADEQAPLRFKASQDAMDQKVEETETVEVSSTAQGDVPRETGNSVSNADSTAQADVSKESIPKSKANSTIPAVDTEESEDSTSERVATIRADGPKKSEEPEDSEESSSKVGSLARRQLEAIEDEAPLKPAAETLGTPIEEETPEPKAGYMKIKTENEKEAVDDPRESVVDDTSEAEESTSSAYTPAHIPTTEEYAKSRIKDERLPQGMVAVTGPKYILRPEAIESVFIMYRITGDPYWREKGWQMFESINKYTAAKHGASAIDDVTAKKPVILDQMESFWLAETLKYFFLLFSDPDVISLDDYVLNTEAHPFKRPK